MQASFPNNITFSTSVADCDMFAKDLDISCGFSPQAVAKPRNIDEVGSLIRWANSTSTGLIPVSSTGAHRRGDTVPRSDGTIIADLSTMRELVHVDARDKIAIIEPGINFGEIDTMLKAHGLRAYRPLKPRAGKSLIASYLDREPLINPNDHWDVADPFGGTCMILGSGELSLTGTAALEGTLKEQLARGHRHMYPSGPTNLDLLRVMQGSQGSLGIMGWGAVFCERIPAVEKSWFACADDVSSVAALATDLLHRRNGSTLFIVDRVQLALLMSNDKSEFEQCLNVLPPWILFITLSGGYHQAERKLAWQTKALAECAQTHGVALHESVGDLSATALESTLRQSDESSFRDRAYGAHKELFFLQSFSGLDNVVNAMQSFVRNSAFADQVIGTYIQPMAQGTYCHVEFTLPYSQDGEHSEAQLNDFWAEAVNVCAQNGAFFSRPYGAWKDIAFTEKQGLDEMLTGAKKVFDPNGVMNPNQLPYEGQEK